MIFVVLGVFVGIVLIIFFVLVDQILQFIVQILVIVQWGNFIFDFKEWMQVIFLNLLVDDVFIYVMDWLMINFIEIGGLIGQGVLVVSGVVFSGFFGVFIVFILMIYFIVFILLFKCVVYQFVLVFKCDCFIDFVEQIIDLVGYYVMGQVLQGVINGVFSVIYLLIIQVLFFVVLVVVVFFFLLILFVGIFMGLMIIVFVCLLFGFGFFGMVIVVVIYYLIYMQIEVYIILLCIMSCVVFVFGVVVVVVVFVGGSLFGLLGVFIVILVVVSILILYCQVFILWMNEF